MRRRCMAFRIEEYRSRAVNSTDDEILYEFRERPQFNRPWAENTIEWRLYIGIMRREAYKRGIWSP